LHCLLVRLRRQLQQVIRLGWRQQTGTEDHGRRGVEGELGRVIAVTEKLVDAIGIGGPVMAVGAVGVASRP
jgi:hypothetical protein